MSPRVAVPQALHKVEPAVFAAGHGSVVAYRAVQASNAVSVLVTQVTLVQVRQGTKVLWPPSRREQTVVREGGLVLLPLGLRLMSEILADGVQYESTVISFDPALLARVIPEGATSAAVQAPVLFSADASLTGLANDLRGRIAHRANRSETDARMFELKLEEAALTLMQSHPQVQAMFSQAAGSGRGTALDRLRQVMARHVCEPLKLPDYALLCGRSLSSFKRDFQRVYGEPAGDWLGRQRLAHAAQLLRSSELSVSEVCVESGFGNLSNFIRAFSAAYQVSPKQYQLSGGTAEART